MNARENNMELTTNIQTHRADNKRVWLVLALPPLFFFALIVGASLYFGMTGAPNEQAIAEKVVNATPYLLLGAQLLMLALVLWLKRVERLNWRALGWRIEPKQTWRREIALGAVIGTALAVSYIFVLAPLMTLLQRVVGDYVPPGELLSSLGTMTLPFFIANVLLAPFVEENLYRGYALARLRQRFSMPIAVALACIFFGLLHWAGGFWYMVLTGSVAGGMFAGLYVWRRNLVAAYAAHLALNVVEFLFVWLVV